MIKLIQELEPKPRQVSVVDLTVCVAERRVHECLNMALVNTTVDRAGSACAVGWCIRLKLAWCLKTNTTFMLLQRHSGLPCLHPPLAVSVSSPILRILPFTFSLLFFQLSHLLSTLLSLRFHTLTLIPEHSFPFHSCFISLLPAPFSCSLFSILAWGLGLQSPRAPVVHSH